jgi:hypothetical protein
MSKLTKESHDCTHLRFAYQTYLTALQTLLMMIFSSGA